MWQQPKYSRCPAVGLYSFIVGMAFSEHGQN